MSYDKVLRQCYRETLLSPLGRKVLGDILNACHFGEMLDANNPQQIGEYNVGIYILSQLGILYGDTRDDVVIALSRVIPQQEEEKENA